MARKVRGKLVPLEIEGRVWMVRFLSDAHSEHVAAGFASRSKGYASRVREKPTGCPAGLPRSSRLREDVRG